MKYVFLYGYDHGGIGDFIKSLKMYINFSFKHNFQIYIILLKIKCFKLLISLAKV